MPVDGLTNSYTNVFALAGSPIVKRTVVQPFIYYTCPPKLKAVFKGTVVCTGLGASARAQLRDPTDSFNAYQWDVAAEVPWKGQINDIPKEVKIDIEYQMSEGDVIKTQQTTGTNAEFEVIGTVQEAPQ